MIDNKKIEEAALGYCAKCSDIINRNVDLDEDECVDLYNGFIDGAKWAINELFKNLWHPASEEPKKAHVFLYKTMFKGYGLNKIIYGNEWKYIIKYQKATQWLYIDDLFQKEGGEHD